MIFDGILITLMDPIRLGVSHYYTNLLLPESNQLNRHVMFKLSKSHKLVCPPGLYEGLIDWVSVCSFFIQYSHVTGHWHHLIPSFLSVAIHLVPLITSKKEHNINIGWARQATLISKKCKITIQNGKKLGMWSCGSPSLISSCHFLSLLSSYLV